MGGGTPTPPPHTTTMSFSSPSTSPPPPTSLLILGAGWTYTFLSPLLTSLSIPFSATTRSGHDGTIPFEFSPESSSSSPSDLDVYKTLPSARCILVTFPLRGPTQPLQLVESYRKVRGEDNSWILLGSTGIWKGSGWHTSPSPYDTENERAQAEDALLKLLGKEACVLNLAGLWGADRHPRNWISKVANTKEKIKGKGGLHLVHGGDVARAIVSAYRSLSGEGESNGKAGASHKVGAKRWLISDMSVYDWWGVVMAFGNEEERRWVRELMAEEGIRALPRDGEALGRRLDGRGFWWAAGRGPERGLMGGEEGG